MNGAYTTAERAYSAFCLFCIVIVSIVFVTLALAPLVLAPGHAINHAIMRYWARACLRPCRVDQSVRGLEHLDRRGVQILAPNHASHFDILVLAAALPVPFLWIAKDLAGRIPFIGWFMHLRGFIFVDRRHPRRAMDRAVAALRRGAPIVLFPEGRMSRDGRLQPFRSGLLHLAAATDAPVVPIVIDGTHDILPPGAPVIRAGRRVVIELREPVRIGQEELGRAGILDDLASRYRHPRLTPDGAAPARPILPVAS